VGQNPSQREKSRNQKNPRKKARNKKKPYKGEKLAARGNREHKKDNP